MDPTDREDVIVRRAHVGSHDIVIREARPKDAKPLREFFDSLSFDDRYRRFFSAFRPDDRFVERLVTANEHGACQLLAIASIGDATDERSVIGEAGAWPLANGNGELAITISRTQRGWLGPYFLDALLEAAARRGIPNLEAEVLATNRRMLALLRDRGYAVAGHDDFTTMRLTVSTESVPSWPPADQRPRVLVETRAGHWSGDSAAQQRGLDVITCPGPAARTARRPCPALAGRRCPLAAGADTIVVDLGGTPECHVLASAHASLHNGVPVCIQTSDDGTNVVELVDRIASLAASHRA